MFVILHYICIYIPHYMVHKLPFHQYLVPGHHHRLVCDLVLVALVPQLCHQKKPTPKTNLAFISGTSYDRSIVAK